MLAVAPVTGSLVVSCQYDETGLAWCRLFDNEVLAWLVDESGVTPPAPVILGTMVPPTAADTAPVLSPQWAVREGATWFVPDMVRGSTIELLTFLATNNGTRRPIYADFADVTLAADWKQWAAVNPSLALKEPPA